MGDELSAVFERIDDTAVDLAVALIAEACRLALYGVGRGGLQIKGFAMRLYHLGLAAAVVGDMSWPPIGPTDLLIASAGRQPVRPARAPYELGVAAPGRGEVSGEYSAAYQRNVGFDVDTPCHRLCLRGTMARVFIRTPAPQAGRWIEQLWHRQGAFEVHPPSVG